MKLTPPKTITFWLSIIIFALGVLGKLGIVAAASGFAFTLVVVAFLLLAISLMVKGL